MVCNFIILIMEIQNKTTMRNINENGRVRSSESPPLDKTNQKNDKNRISSF